MVDKGISLKKNIKYRGKTLIATMFYLWSIMLKPSGELGILIWLFKKYCSLTESSGIFVLLGMW